jgi:phosphoglycolate phosphatase-like HAD superfamily hydrolase
MATKTKTLISFDVDGTLIHSVGPTANKLHKEAFAAAFRQVFDIDTTIDVVPHHGSTDPLILVKVLEFHGISEEKAMASLPAMQDAMINHFLMHKDRAATGLEVLPGVVELLTALQKRDDVAVCLVTGNLEPIGWMKMDKLGIKHLFTEPNFGGFGSDYCSGNTEGMGWRDRAELLRIAARRWSERCGSDAGPRFHIGDAPMDVKAAAAADSHPIGVITGIYTSEQLKEACPTATVLKDLGDIENVLKICNLL